MTEVGIVGAGPVGVVAALALVRQGIEVTLFEQSPELGGEPRAATVHSGTLELLDQLGAAQTVIDCGLPITRLQYRSSRSDIVAEFDFEDLEGETQFPFRLGSEQRTFTPLLLNQVLGSGLCDLRLGTRVTAVRQTEKGVTLGVGPDSSEVHNFRYVIGADGAHSFIRNALAIPYEGYQYGYRFVMVRTTTNPGDHIAKLAPVTYFYDPRESITVLTLPGHWRVVFRLPAETTEMNEGRLETKRAEELLARVIGEEHANGAVIGANVYTVHQRLAEQFAVGNVALAGDAAHLNNPTGGMGMNSGIHDAFHLARVIGELIRHPSGTNQSLEHYATVRRSLAEKYVNRTTDRNFRMSISSDDSARQAWKDNMKNTASSRERRRAYLRNISMLEVVGQALGVEEAAPTI